MKMIKGITLSALTSVAVMAGGNIAPVSVPVIAAEVPVDYGKFNGQIKMIHILDGESNGYDKNTGSAYYVNLGYTTPVWNGLSARVAAGLVGDTGLRDLDGFVAGGIYMGDKSAGETTDTWFGLEEAYLRYQNDTVDAKAGRFRLKTPMTTIKYSTQPNLYEGVTLTLKNTVPQTKFVAGYLTQMMYGARSLSDFGFIGEAAVKGTGAAKQGMHGSSKRAATHRSTFENFGFLAGQEDAGIIMLGVVNKSIPNTKIQAWNYYVDGVANQFYADSMSTFKVDGGIKLKFALQFLAESLEDTAVVDGDNPMIWGAMASAGYKGLTLGMGYNGSNEDQYLNVWGADPLYTTSILTRNAFRPDVNAYKVFGSYKLPKIDAIPGKIILSASYADYGQSSLKNVQEDANERDLVLTYKPTKTLVFKLWNVTSTSEFNGFVNGKQNPERKINQSRFIASYKF